MGPIAVTCGQAIALSRWKSRMCFERITSRSDTGMTVIMNRLDASDAHQVFTGSLMMVWAGTF